MSDNDAFLTDILANPNDHTTRLVYADWLDEQGLPGSAFLRIECEWFDLPYSPEKTQCFARLQEAGVDLESDWVATISRAPIENCDVQFYYRCPKRWELLQVTSDAKIRYCGACQRDVHFCETLQQALENANLGHCVAIDSRQTRRLVQINAQERRIDVGVYLPEPERDIWLNEISPAEPTDSTSEATYYDYQSGTFGETRK